VAAFVRQLEYLKQHFTPVPLTQIVSATIEGRPLPPRAVALTFDDGYYDFGEVIYPILERLELPATLFVVSEFAAGRTWLWFDRLRYVCKHASGKELSPVGAGASLRGPLVSPMDRERTWDRLATHCLRLRPLAREAFIAGCAVAAGVAIPDKPDADHRALSFDELRALDPKWVALGAHTRTHPILSTCTLEEQREEIVGCRGDLERELDRPVTLFCYPNGQPADIDAHSVHVVAEAGFECAVTSVNALASWGGDRLLMPRLGATEHFESFRNEVNGLSELQRQFRGGSGEIYPGEIPGLSIPGRRP
jgi:peptidoglycan/xylan/chitin deacetylase (PgdA/CDA1 family)